MNKPLIELLKKYKNGDSELGEVLKNLRDLPFEDIDFAMVDHHRSLRQGTPEVIYCQGKTTYQVIEITKKLLSNDNILLTKVNDEIVKGLKDLDLDLDIFYNPLAKTIIVNPKKTKLQRGKVIVVTGGTSDIPVAEEAVETLKVLNCDTQTIYDAGVAGIHRLLAVRKDLFEADVIIAIAGMEGALPSVVGGLVDCPVIAVPTSIGYGANLGGMTPLLAMLNSCASGIGVVNIDNGFGAAFLAGSIIRRLNKEVK